MEAEFESGLDQGMIVHLAGRGSPHNADFLAVIRAPDTAAGYHILKIKIVFIGRRVRGPQAASDAAPHAAVVEIKIQHRAFRKDEGGEHGGPGRVPAPRRQTIEVVAPAELVIAPFPGRSQHLGGHPERRAEPAVQPDETGGVLRNGPTEKVAEILPPAGAAPIRLRGREIKKPVAEDGAAGRGLEARGPVLLRDSLEIVGLPGRGRVEPVRPAPRDDVHHAGQCVAVFRFESAGLYLHLPDRGAGDADSGLSGHHVAQGKPVHQNEYLVLPASPDVARAADPGQSGQNIQKSAHGHPVEAVLRHAHRASGHILLYGRGFGLHFDRIQKDGRGLENRTVQPRPQVGPHLDAGDAQDAVSHDAEAYGHVARRHIENPETSGHIRDRSERCILHQHVDAGQRNAGFRVADQALENAEGARDRLAPDEQEEEQDQCRVPNGGTPDNGSRNGR